MIKESRPPTARQPAYLLVMPLIYACVKTAWFASFGCTSVLLFSLPVLVDQLLITNNIQYIAHGMAEPGEIEAALTEKEDTRICWSETRRRRIKKV